MINFTSTPWEIKGTAILSTKNYPDYNRVCEIDMDRDHAEAVANARLIAAAPDLLEALESLIKSAWLSIDHERNRTLESVALRSKAIAAISKATGATQ